MDGTPEATQRRSDQGAGVPTARDRDRRRHPDGSGDVDTDWQGGRIHAVGSGANSSDVTHFQILEHLGLLLESVGGVAGRRPYGEYRI